MPTLEQAASPLSVSAQMRQLSVHSLQLAEIPDGCTAAFGFGKFKISAEETGEMKIAKKVTLRNRTRISVPLKTKTSWRPTRSSSP
jgi:hypothetical protein